MKDVVIHFEENNHDQLNRAIKQLYKLGYVSNLITSEVDGLYDCAYGKENGDVLVHYQRGKSIQAEELTLNES